MKNKKSLRQILIENLERKRLQLGKSKSEVAIAIGKSKGAYSAIHNGDSWATDSVLESLAELYSCEPYELLMSGDGVPALDIAKARQALADLEAFFPSHDEDELNRIEKEIILAKNKSDIKKEDLRFFLKSLIVDSKKNLNRCLLLNTKDKQSGWTWKIGVWPDYYAKWRRKHLPELVPPKS